MPWNLTKGPGMGVLIQTNGLLGQPGWPNVAAFGQGAVS